MIYRTCGNTGLSISILGMGTMRLPLTRTGPDWQSSINLLAHAMKHQINYFDVATFYGHGHCESALGFALEKTCVNIILSAKNNAHREKHQDWSSQLACTLEKINRTSLDIYFLHFLQLDDWQNYYIKEGVIEKVLAAQKKGKFKHLGFSSHDTPANVRLMIDSGLFDAIILPFNLMNRTYETAMNYAAERGLGVIAMNPLAAGALAKATLYAESFKDVPSNQLAALALNYVLSQPFIHCALSGMESSEIIDANIHTVHQPRFSAAEIERLNSAISQEKKSRFHACNACGYCLPCLQGIPIPDVIHMLNQYAVLKGESLHHREYHLLPISAECCIACGQCATRCPQGLDIPKLMSQAADRFAS